MEEVRSYWQVTSITHFCNIFGKHFKLPTFEPEELEQAFILDIPAAPANNNINNNTNASSSTATTATIKTPVTPAETTTTSTTTTTETTNHNTNTDQQTNNNINNHDDIDNEQEDEPVQEKDDDDEEYKPTPSELAKDSHLFQPPALPQDKPQQADEQQELHLLVKLAIALLKPHFNSKISHSNWENYLRRIVDSNWVDLEHHPSPFRVPIVSQDGVELIKNLTFNELPLSDKIDLFYALCDYRLWCEDAAEALKDYPLEELRLESIGKDSHGYEYWYFSGTRLFRENRELSQDIILRKKRIKELEYNLVELEKARIFKEQEEKRKVELERARQLAAEAREARNAAKKQSEQEVSKKRKHTTPVLPLRTGLRERRTSATGNNNDSQQSRTPTTRSKQAKQSQPEQPQSVQKTTRSSAKNSKQIDQQRAKNGLSPDLPRKSPEEECKEELKRLTITPEDRAEAWFMQCDSLEDWEQFATKFEKTKSVNEKYLSAYVNDEILPKIRAVYAKRAAEVRRKEKELLLSLTSRRVSTRIITKRAQEEEEERQAQLQEVELRKKKEEAEKRLRAELEREMRVRKNRFVVNGTTSSTCSEDGEAINGNSATSGPNDIGQKAVVVDGGGYMTRQQHSLDAGDDFGDMIHPDELSYFYEALELIIDSVRISKHAWPFVDPVPDTVPSYYDLITNPMDLRKIRTKIEFREYKSLNELEKDFQLLVNNCERFNGPKNVYTKMVYKLWKSFRKNVRLYLQRNLAMDEYKTFVYPPLLKEEKEEEKGCLATAETCAPTTDQDNHHTDNTQDVIEMIVEQPFSVEEEVIIPESGSIFQPCPHISN